MEHVDNRKEDILDEIRFAYFHPYKVAGMAEPWALKVDGTLQLLREEGIGAILTLTEENPYGERYKSAGFLHHHEPIDDCEPPPSIEAMDRAVEFIDSCLEKGRSVAVHCLEGRGRTGMVLAAWIGIRESLDTQTSINRVYEGRFHTIITPTQRAFLGKYLDGKSEPRT